MRKFIKLIAASLVCTLTISSAVYAGENVKGENAGIQRKYGYKTVVLRQVLTEM